jgi:hypothetical protein
MKCKRRKSEDLVEARPIDENGEALTLIDENKKIKVFAQKGEWLITESDGRQYVLSDTAFKLQFESNRQLLLD